MMQKIKYFISILKADASDTWRRSKMVLLAIGALILTLEFRKIMDAITVYMGQRAINNATKKDANLKTQEGDLNSKADDLIKEASDMPSHENQVGLDWYKKK